MVDFQHLDRHRLDSSAVERIDATRQGRRLIRRLTKSPTICGLMFLDVGAAVEAKSPGLVVFKRMREWGHGRFARRRPVVTRE
jgi:hypothetical protein